MPKNKAINLLPTEEFNASTTGRILKWATSTFRIIVIATEMVVMMAFLSRFWLDARNSDLNNSIKEKGAQISAQVELEEEFRNIQSKLSIYNTISQDNVTSSLIERVVASLPSGVILSRVSVLSSTIEVKGISASDKEIATFVANLQGDPFKKAELGQVSSGSENVGETDFTINITY